MFVAQLPVRYDARWSEAEVLQEIRFPTKQGKWRPRFVANVWGHYKWMMHVMYPRGGPTVVDATLNWKTTKSERDPMSGTRMCHTTKIPYAKQGKGAAKETIQACKNNLCVLWMNNYNIQRY